MSKEEFENFLRYTWKLVERPKISYMGKDRWLANMGTIEEKSKIIKLKEELQGEQISDIQEWSEHCGEEEKELWLKIRGIPAQFWSQKILSSIVESLSSIVEYDAETMEGAHINYARVKIRTCSTPPVEIQLIEGGKISTVKVSVEREKKKKKKRKKSKEKRKPKGRKIKQIWV